MFNTHAFLYTLIVLNTMSFTVFSIWMNWSQVLQYIIHVITLGFLQSSTFQLVGYNCKRPISIYDTDYLGTPKGQHDLSIRQKLLQNLTSRNVNVTPISRIELITVPRYLGANLFNPVNWYYCYCEEVTRHFCQCLLLE